MSDEKYDLPVKEISELLDITAKKLPELISSFIKSIYSQQASSEIGKSVGVLYKELIDAGIPTDVAVKMATDYMISLKDIIKSMNFKWDNKEDDKW